MNSNGSLKILIVEDELDTAKMLRLLLEKKLPAHCEIASDCETFRNKLPSLSLDLITLDFQLPDGDGLTLLSEINSTDNPPPVVMVTGHGDERTAVEAFRQGASGYVVKDSRLSVMLVQEVKSALLKRELRKAELELIENEKLMREIYDTAMGSVAVINNAGTIEYANRRAAAMFGFDSPEELIGTSILDRYADPENRTAFYEKLTREGSVRGDKIYFKRKDGSIGFSVANATLYTNEDGEVLKAVVYATYEVTQEEAEEARGFRENKYRQLVDCMSSGVVICDVVGDGNDFVVVDMNRVAAEYEWIDLNNSLGKSVRKMMPEVVETGILELCRRVWLTGELEYFPPTNYSSGEYSKWIQGYINKLPTDELIAVFDDVTERVDTGRVLSETKEMLDRIYELAAEGIVVSDADNRVEYANRHALELFGFSNLEEFTGEYTENWYVDPEVRRRMYPVLLKSGKVEDVDVELKRRDGGTFWARFNVSVEKNEKGDFIRGITFLTDITKHKEAEAELKASEANLREIYDRALEGICVVDANGNYEFMNKRYIEIFRFENVGELLGTNISERYVHSEDREKVMKTLQEKGFVENYEAELLRKDGTTFWAIMNYVIHGNDDGEFTKYSGFLIDINRRKRIEDERKRANEELEAYAHTVSHNLKGPLAAVALAAEMLYQEIENNLSGDSRELFETIKKNTAIGQSLIGSLLKLAEYGQRPIDVETINIRELVDEVLKVLAGRIEAGGIRVEVDNDMGWLRASRAQIHVVFSNLIGNAIKHNDSEKPEIRICSKNNADSGIHSYQIWDNGSAIPEEELERIFIPFFKGRNTGETGLGLSIARKISNIYNGNVIAYNDNGVCFEATLMDYD